MGCKLQKLSQTGLDNEDMDMSPIECREKWTLGSPRCEGAKARFEPGLLTGLREKPGSSPQPELSRTLRAFPGQDFLHILYFSSFLKYPVSDAHFLSCFADKKTPQQIEDVKYLMTTSTWPQASWSLRTDIVHPCDTTLLPYQEPIRELYNLITCNSPCSPGF